MIKTRYKYLGLDISFFSANISAMSEPRPVRQDLNVGYVNFNNRTFQAFSIATEGLALQLLDTTLSKPGYLQGISVFITSVDPSNLGRSRPYEEKGKDGKVIHRSTELPFADSLELNKLAAQCAPGMIGVARGVGYVLRIKDGVSQEALDKIGLSEYHLASQKKGLSGLWHRFKQSRLPPVTGRVRITGANTQEYMERVKTSMIAISR